MQRILILGLDTFARKNLTQLREMQHHGYAFDVATNDQRADSREIFLRMSGGNCRLFTLPSRLVPRLRNIWSILTQNIYHHVELYPPGRMTLFYLIFLLVLRQKFLVIERGDVGLLDDYDPLTRLLIKASYKLCTAVVYKETYMEPLLQALTSKPLAFAPNCVESVRPEMRPPLAERNGDFLWVNRIIPQRRPAWLVDAFAHMPFEGRRLVMLGVEDRANLPAHIAAEQTRLLGAIPPNVALRGFVDPSEEYRQARYFCLPSTVVFGNNSLLEAMAAGVVPIVTDAPGVELVVQDGVNGIVTALDKNAYQDGLLRAAALTDAEWANLSEAAVKTTTNHYSVTAWGKLMASIYATV